jgi:putative sigma-54 modulation protein
MTVSVEITYRNLIIDDQFKEYITKKAAKLDKYLNEIEVVRVELGHGKEGQQKSDLFVSQITVKGHRVLIRIEERGNNLNKVFDSSIDKIQRQLERYKGKRHHGRGDGRSAAEVVIEQTEENKTEYPVIARHKTFDLIPMSESEALEQMKLLGHDNFFIFYNVETNSINVLYHRRDGSYGLIEPRIG